MRNNCLVILCSIGIGLMPIVASANHHLYDIQEVFSNSDGSVQFVELFTTFAGQNSLNGHTIVASQGASTSTFTFMAIGPTPTDNRTLLIANAAFEAACGITPDFVLPDNFLFDPNGTVNFASGANIATYLNLPLDGVTSLNYPGETSAVDSPTNHAGNSCSLTAASVPSLTPWGISAMVALLAATGLTIRKRFA